MWDLPWLHANSYYFTRSNSKQNVWRPSVRELSKTIALRAAIFPNSLISSTHHDVLFKVSLLLRCRLCVENHIAVKLTRASLPKTNCVRVRMGKRVREDWICLTVILLSLHSSDIAETLPTRCPFPFWNGHTTDTVLKKGLDVKSFYFPVYTCKIVLFICAVKALCTSANCFYPSQSYLDKNSIFAFCLSL